MTRMARFAWPVLPLIFLICNYATAALEDAESALGRSIYETGIGQDGRGSAEAFVQALDIR